MAKYLCLAGGAMKEIPEYIGPYRVLEKLGEGGFATVYLAHRKNEDETQKVALKVLNSRENYRRFQREAETVSRLNHPNIIRIYETGEDPKTRAPFFSMEYIPSGTLFDKLAAEYRLSRIEAVDIIRQIGNALNYPHQQGIIHRDVNPKNILLDTRQMPMRPVLTDFGLVKPLETDDQKLTKTIALIGTFAYYAPEQWMQEELAPATDVYALGITLFEMLSGQRPFKGDVFGLREKHLNEPFPLLSSLAPEVGSFFDEVLVKATTKNPADRYKDTISFVEAVEAANEKADQAARMARRKKAIESIEIAQDRLAQNNYPYDEILEVVDAALLDYPGYGKALQLRGKIELDRQQFPQALADYRQAYHQDGDPSSSAGLGYLQALKQAADYFWQNQEHQEAIKQCRIIKQILDEEHNGYSVQAWQEIWSQLVKAHYDAAVETLATGDIKNDDEMITSLKREIEALEALKADNEARAFKDKLRMLQVKAYHEAGRTAYANGSPKNIKAAIATLEGAIHALGELQADSEQQDLKEKLRALQIKVRYNAGVEIYKTGELENIDQTITTLEQEIEALESLNAHQESQDLLEKLRVLRVKNHYNSGILVYADGTPADINKAIAIMEQEVQLLGKLQAEREFQDLHSKLRILKIKAHYEAGVESFATGDLENIEQTITILEQEIEALESLDAHSESQDLLEKLRVLQVKHHYNSGILAYADGAPENINQAVITLEEEIQALEQLQAEHECQGLREKLKLLQVKRNKVNKYEEIKRLMANEQYEQALNCLDKEFLRVGDYEYQDVARLLWGLTHAKQHQGALPWAWNISAEQYQKYKRQYRIHQFIIPLSLIVAVMLGGIIAPQFENLNLLPILLVLCLVLLVIYFGYYTWVYYIDRTSH